MRRLLVMGLALACLSVPGLAAAAVSDDPLSPAARAWLEDEGPLRVGWFRGAPPVSVWDGDELRGGYATNAFDLGALKVGVEVEHVVYDDIPAVVEALRTGEIDVAGAHGARPDLLGFAVPTEPTAWERITFVTRPDRVAAVAGLDVGTASTIAGSPLEGALLERFPALTYVPTDGIVGGLQQVADGEVDLYLGPLATIGSLLAPQDLDLVPVGPAVDVVPIGSWVVDDTPAAEIATAIRASITPAELATLHVRWTGFDLGAPDADGTPVWLVPVLAGLFAAALVLAAFVVVLRSRVRGATEELRAVNESLEETVDERTAQLRRQSTALRRSNEALQRFSSTAAHDLKGPLTAIAGLADLAIRAELAPDDQQAVLTRVKASAVRLGRMVDGKLADALAIGTATVGLTGALYTDWVREVCGPELDVVGADLEVRAPDASVPVDVEVLRRATMNLVSNSVKYGVNEDVGTRIRVALQPGEGQTWTLSVADNGPGIPPTMWSQVFERGTRLTHDDRGFGLGLSAIRDLVQGAGGSIRVGIDDELGGAEFVVTLPVVEDAAQRSVQGADDEGGHLLA